MKAVTIWISILLVGWIAPTYGAECTSKPQSANDLYKCALSRDPRIRSLSVREKEREGRGREARQIPNPVGEVEGTSEELSASIVQPIEIGGKRSARIEASEAENEISKVEEKVDFGAAALDIVQSILKLSQTNTKLKLLDDTKKSLANLSSRLRAKAVRTPEERTAVSLFQMQSTLIETRLIHLRREQAEAKSEVEASTGQKFEDLGAVTAYEVRKWPSLDGVRSVPALNLKLKELALKRLEADAKAQRGAAWPELALGPYYSKNEQAGEENFGVKIEFGLPVWNRNRGAIQRADAEYERARVVSEYTLTRERVSLDIVLDSYKKLVSFLSQSSSSRSLHRSVTETLQLFSRGMIQPSNVIETYRTAYETMEAVQDAEYTAISYYWLIQTARGEVPKEIP